MSDAISHLQHYITDEFFSDALLQARADVHQHSQLAASSVGITSPRLCHFCGGGVPTVTYQPLCLSSWDGLVSISSD